STVSSGIFPRMLRTRGFGDPCRPPTSRELSACATGRSPDGKYSADEPNKRGGPSVFPFTRPLIALAPLIALTAPPAAQDTRPTITPANASRLRPIGEVPRDARRMVWGPGDGRLALLGWETPVEVLDARTLRPMQRLAADRRLVDFAATADGNTV